MPQGLECPICFSKRLKSEPFGYRFNGNWLGGVRCRECSVIFIHPQPSAEELTKLYSGEYFAGDFRCGHEGNYFDDATLGRVADGNLLQRIKRDKSGGCFLEIGCAGGAFLNAARAAGFDVHGVEFSDEAAQFARTRFGLDVRTGDIQSVNLPSETYDVVFMGDVLEHLTDPVAALREINRAMKTGGVLVILCPMQTNTLFSRLGFLLYGAIGKKATVALPPYHVFEYRPRSLAGLVRRCGFRVDRMKETIIPPSKIAQRGSFIMKKAKKAFHYPNYFLTAFFGVLGDRVECHVIKETTVA